MDLIPSHPSDVSAAPLSPWGSLEVTLELQCFVALTELLQHDSVTLSVCPLNRVQVTQQNLQ